MRIVLVARSGNRFSGKCLQIFFRKASFCCCWAHYQRPESLSRSGRVWMVVLFKPNRRAHLGRERSRARDRCTPVVFLGNEAVKLDFLC